MNCLLKCNFSNTICNVTSRRIVSISKKSLSYWSSVKTRSENRQKRMFEKMVKGNAKRKKFYVQDTFGFAKPSAPVASGLDKKVVMNRRSYILNNLFMEHVTDVMSTGEIGSQLQGYSIEITHVKVSCDYKLLNVYWMVADFDPTKTEKAEKLLFSLGGEIRNLLSNLRLIGHIPKLIFVRDKKQAYLMELHQKLAIADYGPSDVPDENSSDAESPKELAREKEESAMNQDLGEHNFLFAPPEMRQDIFGLDHSRLMSDVLQFRKKAAAAHRNPDCPYVFHYVPTSPTTSPAVMNIQSSSNNGGTSVKDFLSARKKEAAKLRKEMKLLAQEKYREEMDILRQEQVNVFEELGDEPDFYEEESCHDT